MMKRRYPPFSKTPRSGPWQVDHVFVLIGPGAYDTAASLYRKGQCQPAIAVPNNASPELYRWPVFGSDVTLKNYGKSDSVAEQFIYELLRAGARLVVCIDEITSNITVHRPRGESDAA